MFKDLVELLNFATETEAKEAAAWLLGEYAEEIYKGAIQTFHRWIETFNTEERAVQLQILTSAVKVFIKYPDECESLISQLLTIATERVGNPDVRDRYSTNIMQSLHLLEDAFNRYRKDQVSHFRPPTQRKG